MRIIIRTIVNCFFFFLFYVFIKDNSSRYAKADPRLNIVFLREMATSDRARSLFAWAAMRGRKVHHRRFFLLLLFLFEYFSLLRVKIALPIYNQLVNPSQELSDNTRVFQRSMRCLFEKKKKKIFITGYRRSRTVRFLSLMMYY